VITSRREVELLNVLKCRARSVPDPEENPGLGWFISDTVRLA